MLAGAGSYIGLGRVALWLIEDEPLAFLDPSKIRPPKAALDEIVESFQ
jgi:hypothetical protein